MKRMQPPPPAPDPPVIPDPPKSSKAVAVSALVFPGIQPVELSTATGILRYAVSFVNANDRATAMKALDAAMYVLIDKKDLPEFVQEKIDAGE